MQKGRTEARESEPVKPVDPEHVAAVLPRLGRHIRGSTRRRIRTAIGVDDYGEDLT